MRPTLQTAVTRLQAHVAGWRARPHRAQRDSVAPQSDLEDRVTRLEAGLEALEDATYRQDVMHDAKIAELRHRQGPV